MKLSRIVWSVVAIVIGTRATYAAGPALIAAGSLSGSGSDLSAQTAKPLENAAPGNLFGGIGSGLGYAGGDRFLAVPDRGPNAVHYDGCVDDTTSYINRFHDLRLQLKPNGGEGLPFVLKPSLEQTTLLWNETPLVYGNGTLCPVVPPGGQPALPDGTPKLNNNHTFYFTGRSDGFGGGDSLDPTNARFDPESVRLSKDGKSIFISDEYGPYIYQFDRESGRRIRVFTLPGRFAVSLVSSQGDLDEIPHNGFGRVANKGMEGLAITPDGSTLVGIMQSALIQDGGDKKGQVVRLVKIDIASGAMQQYAYPTFADSKTTVSDIVAVNDHVFLVDERDGAGLGDNSAAVFKKLYLIDIDGAQELTMLDEGKAALVAKAVKKYLFLDVVSGLATGLGLAATQVPAKLEGIAIGADATVGDVTLHTLYIGNDNDFDPSPGNPNQFFVFGFSDDDLASAKRSDDMTHTFGGDGHDATFVPQVFEKK